MQLSSCSLSCTPGLDKKPVALERIFGILFTQLNTAEQLVQLSSCSLSAAPGLDKKPTALAGKVTAEQLVQLLSTPIFVRFSSLHWLELAVALA